MRRFIQFSSQNSTKFHGQANHLFICYPHNLMFHELAFLTNLHDVKELRVQIHLFKIRFSAVVKQYFLEFDYRSVMGFAFKNSIRLFSLSIKIIERQWISSPFKVSTENSTFEYEYKVIRKGYRLVISWQEDSTFFSESNDML